MVTVLWLGTPLLLFISELANADGDIFFTLDFRFPDSITHKIKAAILGIVKRIKNNNKASN